MYKHVQVHTNLSTYVQRQIFLEDVYVYNCIYRGILKVKSTTMT